VWVRLGANFKAAEIYKSFKECIQANPPYYIQLDRHIAVSEIRKQVWDRIQGECTYCGQFVTEETFHMHEEIPRGQGGNYSLENSIGICSSCHLKDVHGNRNPRFGENSA